MKFEKGTHYYEVRSGNSYQYGFVKASSDLEAVERLSNQNVLFLQRVRDGIILVDTNKGKDNEPR